MIISVLAPAILFCFYSCAKTQKATSSITSTLTLKKVYKDTFMFGAAVNNAIVSGAGKGSQETVLNQFNSITISSVPLKRK